MIAFGPPKQHHCALPVQCNCLLAARPMQRLGSCSAHAATEQRSLRRQSFGPLVKTALANQESVRTAGRSPCCCRACVKSEPRQNTWKTPALQALILAAVLLLPLGLPPESHAATHQAHGTEAFQLASEDSEFWVNVSRYGRYFITVLLGTAYISVKPVLELLKRPKTAFLVVAGIAVLYLFVSTTVQAMLGVSNPLEYQPSSFFPDNY